MAKEEQMVEFIKHPQVTVDLLNARKNQLHNNVFSMILQHHENIDGSGFPKGLKGMQINYYSKIMKIANDFDLWYRFINENGKFEYLKYILIIIQNVIERQIHKMICSKALYNIIRIIVNKLK